MTEPEHKRFDLEGELAEIKRQLGEVEAFIRVGANELRLTTDFGLRCLALAEKARALAGTVPPPEPSPPRTEEIAKVPERRLAKATPFQWLISRLRSLGRPPRDLAGAWGRVDANGMVPVRTESERRVLLDDPRMPGSPAGHADVSLVVADVVQVPHERFRWLFGSRFIARLRWLYLPQLLARLRWLIAPPFLYEEQQVRRTIRIHVKAVPPDRPLTPIQAKYLARKKELAEETRDLNTFCDKLEARVRAQQASMRALVAGADQLVKDVEGLPRPDARSKELEAHCARMQALEQGLPAVEQSINLAIPELAKLKEQALTICPELRL